MPQERRLHLRVYGWVQGVFFRATTLQEARRLGLRGWVRNCADGSVEAVVEGPAAACDALLRFCRRGPPGANVERVEERWEEATGEFADFEIRY